MKFEENSQNSLA